MMSKFNPSTLKTRRVSCWNCRKEVFVPLAIDPSSIMDDIPRFIIPIKMDCPYCGDKIYKYKCREDSEYVH